MSVLGVAILCPRLSMSLKQQQTAEMNLSYYKDLKVSCMGCVNSTYVHSSTETQAYNATLGQNFPSVNHYTRKENGRVDADLCSNSCSDFCIDFRFRG